jgi:ABC-type nitrate/sulfonate/bicarbonate transport system ATPase subunit
LGKKSNAMNGTLKVAIDGFSFDDNHVVAALDFAISEAETIAIMGPSGSGKTTLLRLLAGFETPQGRSVISPGAEHTRIALLAQDLDAFPWMTVAENVWRFQANHSGSNKDTERLLGQVGLARFAAYYPLQLSGGMRKRLALARILTVAANVVLLDEPFSSLDLKTKKAMAALFRAIQDEQRFAACIITHDVLEAVSLASRALVCSGPPLRVVEVVDIAQLRPDEAISTLQKALLKDE